MLWCKLGGKESTPVLNFSEDGLCFESLTPIEEKGLLQLRLSVDVNHAIVATGWLAWLDSAKRRGGVRFLELSAQARHQIRAWLSRTSVAPSGRNWRQRDKQAAERVAPEIPVIWQATRIRSTQLVPIGKHLAQTRWRFLLGVLLGFGIYTLVMISIFRDAYGTKLRSLAWTVASANRAAQSSAQQTQASAVQSASPSAPISKQAATQTASVAAPASSLQNQSKSQIKKQSPPSAGAASTNLTTRTSSPSATQQPAKLGERVASSRPSTKAERFASSHAAPAPAPSASSQQVLHPKKAPPTPQQLWAALQKGNVKAAVALADLYARGEGVPQNCQQARALLLAASEKHNAEATKKLQELDKGGCPANSE